MTDSYIRVSTDGSGKKVDAEELVVGSNTVHRQRVSIVPATLGGCSISRLISAATTNSTLVSGGPAQVYGWHLSSTSADPRYVKLYDKATAPTVGTDTPVLTLMIPQGGSTAGGVAQGSFPLGIAFTTGIGFGITADEADNDTTAISADEVIVNIFYK